jgi:hypothetical protein
MRCGEWLRAWPTAGRLASKGIANHVALRLKLQGERGVLACATRAILGRMRLNFRGDGAGFWRCLENGSGMQPTSAECKTGSLSPRF